MTIPLSIVFTMSKPRTHWRRAKRVFADQQALPGDAVGQIAVARRIDAIGPRADDGNGGQPLRLRAL